MKNAVAVSAGGTNGVKEVLLWSTFILPGMPSFMLKGK